MSEPIDPGKGSDLLKELFQDAAAHSPLWAKATFERLSSTFNELKEAVETNAYRMRIMETNHAYETALREVHALAKVDDYTYETLRGIYETVDKAKRGEYIPVQKKPQQQRPGKSGQCHI